MPLTRERGGFLNQEKRKHRGSLFGGSLGRTGAGTRPIHGFPLLPALGLFRPLVRALQSLPRIIGGAPLLDARFRKPTDFTLLCATLSNSLHSKAQSRPESRLRKG